ncbi:hypothetical protein LTS18_012148 [Coniosporium uncinatum]|uniref:Uncharacterized protein n=1 Tax=Coniosporium uncinatum TaxID=93489 RepID=A0ACC3D9I2_9PEZI|nr:hypothetical protein LTS18_012148 [Coniosporium uncinatum]
MGSLGDARAIAHHPSVELTSVLDSLGLGEYSHAFIKNGYETWDSVLNITEDDLSTLGVKPDHLRVLQCEIARFQPHIDHAYGRADRQAEEDTNVISPTTSETSGRPKKQQSPEPKTTKRRYRRHPRPDSNAPKRPKSAYVRFADELRTDPKIGRMSFVQIAKYVGERWQQLDPTVKKHLEHQASRALDEYELQMDDYKKTSDFRAYQRYLEDFQAQQVEKNRNRTTKPSAGLATDASPRQILMAAESNSSVAASDRKRSTSGDTNNPGSSVTSIDGDEDCAYALKTACTDIVRQLEDFDQSEMEAYGLQKLPLRETALRGSTIFCEGTVLYASYTHEKMGQLMDRLYGGKKRDPHDVIDLLAMTATGAFCDPEGIATSLKRPCYASCVWLLTTLEEPNYLRCMRLLMILTIYCTLEKLLLGRRLIASALHIGRSQLAGGQISRLSEEEQKYWRRVFRSVVFVESWLSYSLNYTSPLTDEDLFYAGLAIEPHPGSIEEGLQIQASKVGLMAVEISRDVGAAKSPNIQLIKSHMVKLNAWHRDLPPMMHLAALNSEKQEMFSPVQQRSMLLVHMLYLSVVTLLHRQVLLSVARSKLDSQWYFDASEQEVYGLYDYCILVAQQSARIAAIVQTGPQECWFSMYVALTSP